MSGGTCVPTGCSRATKTTLVEFIPYLEQGISQHCGSKKWNGNQGCWCIRVQSDTVLTLDTVREARRPKHTVILQYFACTLLLRVLTASQKDFFYANLH